MYVVETPLSESHLVYPPTSYYLFIYEQLRKSIIENTSIGILLAKRSALDRNGFVPPFI